MVILAATIKKPPAANETAALQSWFSKQKAVNGLESADLKPWHIILSYDPFDEDRDHVHSGAFEAYWLSPNQSSRVY
jgi:hypothetical protein